VLKNKKAHPWKRPYDINRAIEKALVSGYQFPVLENLDDLPGIMTDEEVIATYTALANQEKAELSFDN
jgi:hypothetical protein